MPSAANVKIEKQVNQENALAESSQNLTPLRQAITVIEHKIRNLEKRKTKLESYRELQNAGKELNADQKTAVAKFGEVLNTLDFARDLCKQFLGIASATEKEAKKLAKKEAALKYQAELARLREILLVQDALNQMGNEAVRDDFLNGRNGAAQLTEADLKLLDDFYPAVTPKHEAGNPTTFTNEVQSAAEHLLAAVDGKPKDVFGGTYSQVKEILGKIHESGYFDQAQVFESYSEEAVVESEGVMVVETNTTSEIPMVAGGAVPPLSNHQQPPAVGDMPVIESLTIEARCAAQPLPAQVPLEVVQQSPAPAAVSPQQQAVPPQVAVAAAAATVVPPPEQQMYYQPAAPSAVPPPQQQPPRPITEMLGTGSFFFLQESEIDPIPEQIPSQTFTNQNFSGGPPPPAALQPTAAGPLAPHFAASIPQQPPMGAATPVANHQPLQPVQAIGNNGLVDDGLMGQPKNQQHVVAKEAMQGGPPRTGPTYYQDNGYSRQQQRGQHPPRPRPVNARH